MFLFFSPPFYFIRGIYSMGRIYSIELFDLRCKYLAFSFL